MMFSTQRAKPHTPTLVLHGTNIVLSEKVRYFGVLVDQNLRFHEHVQSVVTTVPRRMYIVKNFVYLSSKPLANYMLFKSFIMSGIAYCLPLIFTCIYASEKKATQKIFKDCSKLGIEYLNIDLHIQKLTKELAIKYIVENDYFINNFLSQCPSGRY